METPSHGSDALDRIRTELGYGEREHLGGGIEGLRINRSDGSWLWVTTEEWDDEPTYMVGEYSDENDEGTLVEGSGPSGHELPLAATVDAVRKLVSR